MIAPLTSPPGLVKTNATMVVWSNMNNIYALPMSAAPGTEPPKIALDAIMCNNGAPFAIDDANLYYLASGSGCGQGSGTCQGLTQVSLSTMTSTLLVASQPNGGGVQMNLCGSLAVDATFVYVLVSQQNGPMTTYAVDRARIGVAGQTLEMLGSATSYNGSSSALVVNSTNVLFETQGQNGSQALQMIPLDGSPKTALPINVNGYGNRTPFVADDTNAYFIGSGCPCNNNNGNQPYQGPPEGVLTKVPLHGGPAVPLATFSGQAGDIAMDGTNVYWSTDASAWKIPLGGGVAEVIAGNLTGGTPASQCNGCGGGQNQSSTVAVGATGLYIALPSPTSALLEVSK
jgi:hypothetical protein